MKIQLPDESGEIEPVPMTAGGRKPEPELERLSNILKTFNDQFGNIAWSDADRVHNLIAEEIPARVAADTAYQNAKKNSDKQNARIEHDKALQRVMTALLKDDTELYRQFSDNPGFKRWLSDMVFTETYALRELVPRPERALAELEKRLRESDDPLDALCLALLPALARHARLTLGDALALARDRRLSDSEALAAVERLARPTSAGLRRYYIDRSGDEPRVLMPDEVRAKLVALRTAGAPRKAWTLAVEVAWANSETKALGQAGVS
jgi:type I restriction enzyme R subunit